MQTGVRRVVLVGTGFVGMSFAYSMLNQGGLEEFVLVDVNKDKAEGEAMDLSMVYHSHQVKWISGLEHMKIVKLQIL